MAFFAVVSTLFFGIFVCVKLDAIDRRLRHNDERMHFIGDAIRHYGEKLTANKPQPPADRPTRPVDPRRQSH